MELAYDEIADNVMKDRGRSTRLMFDNAWHRRRGSPPSCIALRCRCGLGEVNGGRGGKGRGAPANDGGPRRLRACGALRETPSTGQRRPALPRAYPAVPSALAGLASGFGMGPGVPRPPEPLTGGRRSAHPGRPPRALGAAQRASAAPRGARDGRMGDEKSSGD